MAVTVRDVAARAQVSVQTVSNVVNGRPIVAEATRQRVLKALAELGYQPNAIARGLRSNCAHTIGVVFITTERRYLVRAPYLNEVVSGIADAARDSEYELLLQSVAPHEHPSAVTQLFRRRQIDGVILTSAELGEPYVEELTANDVPFVLIDRPVAGERAACVRADNRGGALAAVRYLIQRGHTHIGLISGALNWHSGVERLAGYRQALAERGLPEAVTHSDWSREGGHCALGELLDQWPKLTAVFVASDLMAVGAMEAACTRGLRVPEDLALVGFDDLTFATMVRPPLTTVRLPAYDMGVEATQLILGHLTDGRFPQPDVVLPTELVVRESA
ncbi:MAG: LacI family DNA-binding transcriptional regulator [Chloroflexi bacterium]|nr:LacI family DNA-binding transcriptional regulator [Chloroflexota bacterium]